MPEGLERRRELLRKVPLFARLPPDALATLAQAATTTRLDAREELFHKGDAAAQVYVVTSGRLKVVTGSAEGDEAFLAILGPGDVVGELPMLTGGRRTASVVALEPCELLALSRRDFLQLLRDRHEVAVELVLALAERLIHANEFVAEALFLAIPARLARKLLGLAESYGVEEGGSLRIDLKLFQGELADLVGVTRVSINKQMRAWTDEGVLRMERGEITILDPMRLERLAGLVST